MPDIIIEEYAAATELWEAAYKGDVQKLKSLLANTAYKELIDNNTNSHGHSALFFACYGDANAETVRLLLDAGANPFLRDKKGHLPLHFAANSLDNAIITTLLEIPGMLALKQDAATGTGQTPLHAIFAPGASASKSDKTDAIANCVTHFLERDKEPLKALHRKDLNGLSTFMLIKHYGLRAGIDPHVPSALRKPFAIFVSSIQVPANTETLVKDHYSRMSFSDSLPKAKPMIIADNSEEKTSEFSRTMIFNKQTCDNRTNKVASIHKYKR